MSGSQWEPPPPGWMPPPEQRPTWTPPPGPPPPYAAYPAPSMLGAAHKPGALPLRPLGLGDIYDAAFKVIRFNPKATVGAAVLVAAVAMAVPIVAAAGITAALGLTLDGGGDLATADDASAVLALGSILVGSVLQYVGLVFVTGMIAHVVAAAAIGRRLSLGEAWAATRGRRWRLVGLTVTIGLAWILAVLLLVVVSVLVVVLVDVTAVTVVYFLVMGPAAIALSIWAWIRVTYLAVPALMLDGVGVFASLGRAYRLSSRQFWRTFGIALLTLLITSVAAQMLTIPFSIIGMVATVGIGDSTVGLLVYLLVNALGTVVSTAFVTPFTSAVTSVQYLDQRIRKEAYDVELTAQAGIATA
jgi:hypothetical protein